MAVSLNMNEHFTVNLVGCTAFSLSVPTVVLLHLPAAAAKQNICTCNCNSFQVRMFQYFHPIFYKLYFVSKLWFTIFSCLQVAKISLSTQYFHVELFV